MLVFATGPHREQESLAAVVDQHYERFHREDEKSHQQLMMQHSARAPAAAATYLGIYAPLATNLPKASPSAPYKASRPPSSQLASVQGNTVLTAPATQGLHWQIPPR
ncbi:hypothetical protein CCMA1212_007140 [Trichoderma ghanense]|uniref:Uncharacterized protein n=1 Tax=Trichoderma ghanense TaxID=65468 RepID=A0ABY2GZW1_9HYPO